MNCKAGASKAGVANGRATIISSSGSNSTEVATQAEQTLAEVGMGPAEGFMYASKSSRRTLRE